MQYTLSNHARLVLHERGISIEWLERTLNQPEWTTPDPVDPQVRRYFRTIPEFGGRALRVGVNVHVEPPRVVSVFFDRSQRGRP